MFFKDETGTSMIEVMIAIMVFMIIMVGGLQYFTLPQQIVARKKIKRLAVAEAQRRMEALVSLGFTGVVTDSNETNTSVTLAGITGNGTRRSLSPMTRRMAWLVQTLIAIRWITKLSW